MIGGGRTWLEIDKKALIHNLGVFRRFAGKGTLVMSVVKSNAYGHDMVECAKIFEKSGTDFLGVDDIDEAIILRKAGIKKPILVLGYTMPSRYAEAYKQNISITISSIEQLKRLASSGQKLNFHLKVDTGLNRQGINPDQINTTLQIIALAKSVISLQGLYSHFAAAENPKNRRYAIYTAQQLASFNKLLEKIEDLGLTPITHISGTAATFSLSDARFGMVRAGIGLYGLWPSEESKQLARSPRSTVLQNDKIILKPALAWKTIISEVKKVKKGSAVGYDLTEKVSRDSMLAVIPVGYWHGFDRSLSNKGIVLVRGVRCKVVGRISMDMSVIDVTDVRGVREGDEVVLIGSQKRASITAEEMADLAGTINYEIVTRINPLIPRKFL